MHPFYFGVSQKPLFGVYHPPHRETERSAGVVICYPFGQEYIRGHRAFRQLALLLSRAGFHVLRFDYYATGDSGGDGTEGRIAQWIADIQSAIDELLDMAGISAVALVGTRLGAALCVEAASHRSDVDAVALWDPVVKGAEYLAEISTGGFRSQPSETGNGDIVAAVWGFPITRVLWDELAALDILDHAPHPRTRIVVSSETDSYRRMHQAWPTAEYAHVPSKGNWSEVDNFGSALVPQEIIRDIVAWLEQGALQ